MTKQALDVTPSELHASSTYVAPIEDIKCKQDAPLKETSRDIKSNSGMRMALQENGLENVLKRPSEENECFHENSVPKNDLLLPEVENGESEDAISNSTKSTLVEDFDSPEENSMKDLAFFNQVYYMFLSILTTFDFPSLLYLYLYKDREKIG